MVTLEEMQLQMGFSQHALLGWAEMQSGSVTTGGKRVPRTELPLKASGGRELLSATRDDFVTGLSSSTFHSSSINKMPLILVDNYILLQVGSIGSALEKKQTNRSILTVDGAKSWDEGPEWTKGWIVYFCLTCPHHPSLAFGSAFPAGLLSE